MFVFYDWSFSTPVYFAKNVAYFLFNSWLSFQRLCRILWGYTAAERLQSVGLRY